MTNDIAAIFERARCVGTLCVQPLDGSAEVALRADEPMAPASAVKVQIALEAETWFADGRLVRAVLIAWQSLPRSTGLGECQVPEGNGGLLAASSQEPARFPFGRPPTLRQLKRGAKRPLPHSIRDD